MNQAAKKYKRPGLIEKQILVRPQLTMDEKSTTVNLNFAEMIAGKIINICHQA